MMPISQSTAYTTPPRTKAAYELEALLDYIKRSRGFDFTSYKRPSLMRLVMSRIQKVGIDSCTKYIDYLKAHPQEFTHLFNTLLVNVTSFFRDRSVWDYLSHELIPQIVAKKEPDEPIRVWSAACASGEEAYSLAIILAEILGIEQFQARVKIYATDIDEEALKQARQGTYTAKEVAGIPPALLEKYFDSTPNSYIVHKELRSALLFSRHNLIEDAPISRLDLLMCRNALMYFNPEAQRKIQSRFHFALRDSGFLVLGHAEGLLNSPQTFSTADLKRRVYTKTPKVNVHLNASEVQDSKRDRIRQGVQTSQGVQTKGVQTKGEELRSLTQTSPEKAVKPLEKQPSYFQQELQQAFQQAFQQVFQPEFQQVFQPQVKTKQPSSTHQALTTEQTQLLVLQEELKTVQQERLDLKKQLNRTQEELQSTHEQLQTMNQELQSLSEELYQRNEELNQAKALLKKMTQPKFHGVA
ncbi:chemotaxis protein CheR [Trichocoleus sp. ST-U3]|uniref:CheR family methyltransferase n=1 Tax=Coleofasciculus sp. FACHB-542 TaxID=2692787 RepID=UPI0018F00043|nr:protein-glutamate O-methyltransferase CheR [Coleofasciculus sp. FACHB-542]